MQLDVSPGILDAIWDSSVVVLLSRLGRRHRQGAGIVNDEGTQRDRLALKNEVLKRIGHQNLHQGLGRFSVEVASGAIRAMTPT